MFVASGGRHQLSQVSAIAGHDTWNAAKAAGSPWIAPHTSGGGRRGGAGGGHSLIALHTPRVLYRAEQSQGRGQGRGGQL